MIEGAITEACSFRWRLGVPDSGVRLEQKADGVDVSLPLTATTQLYYRSSGDQIVVSDDLRALYQPGDSVDECAIHSLLQFGAAIPPLSPWKQVRRLVPGRVTKLRPPLAETGDRMEEWAAPLPNPTQPSLDEQIIVVHAALDRTLLRCCGEEPVIILFSGGVDSGLLAARASTLKLKNIILVNYCFGPDDAESIHAERMAGHLRLPFIRVQDDPGAVTAVLEHAGELYRYPFCDHSAVPAYALVQAVKSRFGERSVVLEGTGADGAFGLFSRAQQWLRLHRIPRPVLAVASGLYRAGRVWQRLSRVEYYLRLLHRASLWRYPLAAVAQNPLAGIAYHPSSEVRNYLETCVEDWLSAFDRNAGTRLAALDLALVGSAIFAQKTRSLFDSTPLRVVYPFLESEVVGVAFQAGDWPGSRTEPKWVLKAALARQVPPEMVYRRKIGFIAPTEGTFRSKVFLEAFDRMFESKSFLSGFIDHRIGSTIRGNLLRGAVLPSQTAYFVWAMVFLNCWFEGASRARPAAPGIVGRSV